MADPIAALREGLRDRYEFERELGRGGMATVYLARDLKHDRPVALKLLRPELSQSLGPARFEREIRLAARLQHPHILPVHDSGAEAGQCWYTMPYIEGESLRDRLRREGQLPLEDALRITREVADALGYAHAQGIVHRDIKPENILLSRGHALVADFGIARAVQDGDSTLTETGMSLGTPAYMSPEQSLADPKLDGRSDLYSLGCVLYEMLVGEPPYTGTSSQAILAKRLREPIPHARTVRESVPAGVDQALQRVMAKTAADRYPTAAAFLGDLAAEPAAAMPLERAASPARWWSSGGVRRGAGIGLVLAALAGALLWRRTPASTPTAATPDGTIRLAVIQFENEGAPADEYFADGLSDEVRGKLSGLPTLRVTARSSSSEYKAARKSPREIGRELGVQYLLAGTVRWDKGSAEPRVRVSPELILADEASTVWQAPFDAPLTDVFGVQTQIAEKVAQALKLVLRSSDRSALAERPTQNLAAYDEFLRGEELSASLSRTDANTLKQATEHYQRAVELDSTFAAAWLQLTRAHANIYSAGFDPTPRRKEATRQAFERVRRLRPDAVESHWAASVYYGSVVGDVPRARQETVAALRLAPRNPDLLRNLAGQEMGAGQWDSALAYLRQAVDVDPRSVNTVSTEAYTLMLLRRYPASTQAARRALTLDSTNLDSWKTLAMGQVAEGHLEEARATTRAAAARLGSTAVAAYYSTYQMSWLLDSSAQRAVLALRPSAYGDDTTSWGSALWSTLLLLGDTAKARIYNDSALSVQERLVAEDPANFDQRQHLARMLAAAGFSERADREAKRALADVNKTGDSMMIGYVHDRVARILLLLGRKDEALTHLRAALAAPDLLTRAWVRLDPEYARLWGDPRLGQLQDRP